MGLVETLAQFGRPKVQCRLGTLPAEIGLALLHHHVVAPVSVDDGNQMAGLVMLAEAIGRDDWSGAAELIEGGVSVGGLCDLIALCCENGLNHLTM